MTKYIENIVIGIPIVPCGILLSDGTTTDMMNEVDKTYFTNNHNIAHILKELSIVSSLNEVRRNKPSLCSNLDKNYLDCFWIKWGKRKFYIIKGQGVPNEEYAKWRGYKSENH